MVAYLVSFHYAASRKVAGSIPDEVIRFFNWPNPSSHTMTMRLTQLLKKLVPGILLGNKGRPARKADNLADIYEWIV
jgi:hypothetical protein